MLFSFRYINLFISIVFWILVFEINILNVKAQDQDSIEVFKLCDSAIVCFPDYNESLRLVSTADSVSKELNCNNCTAEVDFTKGVIYYNISSYDTALYFFNSSLDIYLRNNETIDLIETYEYISSCYAEMYRNTDAIKYLKLGLLISDSINDKVSSAQFNLLLGSCYEEMGIYDESTSSTIKALTQFELMGDSSGISSALINLGIVFSSENNFIDAFNYTSRALEICETLDDKEGVSVCLNNIGDIYSSQKNFQKALGYFNRSLEIDRDLQDEDGIAISLNNIGDTYKDLNDTVLALSFYQKSLDVGRPINSQVVSLALSNLGEHYLRVGNIDKALNFTLEALEVAMQKGSNEQLLNCYKLLNKIYFAAENYKDAYYYFEKYHSIHDSILSKNKIQQIQEISAKYIDKKKNNELNTLRRKHTSDSQIRTLLYIIILVISIIILSMIFYNVVMRRSRRLARKQNEYYEKLLDRSEDFIFVVGKDGLTKYISPSYERRIGREILSRINKSAFEFIHPQDIEHVKHEFNNLIIDGKPRNIDFRMQNAYGEWISVYAYGQNLLDDKLINGIVVNFWDITQRKRNEEIIRKSELKFRQLFAAFPDVYFQLDTKGVITDVSPSIYKITGYTREEVIGVSSKEYYHFIHDWKKIAARIENNESINDHDTKFKKKDGGIIHCSFTAELVYDTNSEPIGIMGVLHDISGRVKSQRKLRKSQRELRESNAAKEKIFSIIAHDLIGPIGTNKSIVDLIVGQVDELSHEEIVTLITSLKPSLDSTYSLIENLLSWARIQQNSLKPNFENILLNDVISLVVELLSDQAQRKLIDLIIVADEPINVLADKNQIDIVIRNIVSNAIKFSHKKSVIKISITKINKMAEIRISDTGVGMTWEQINNVLSGKASKERKRGTDNEKGTGFGLVIVNEFVKNNKGSISIESEIGEGTDFSILLPISVHS